MKKGIIIKVGSQWAVGVLSGNRDPDLEIDVADLRLIKLHRNFSKMVETCFTDAYIHREVIGAECEIISILPEGAAVRLVKAHSKH